MGYKKISGFDSELAKDEDAAKNLEERYPERNWFRALLIRITSQNKHQPKEKQLDKKQRETYVTMLINRVLLGSKKDTPKGPNSEDPLNN